MAKAAHWLLSPPKKSVWLPVNGQADECCKDLGTGTRLCMSWPWRMRVPRPTEEATEEAKVRR